MVLIRLILGIITIITLIVLIIRKFLKKDFKTFSWVFLIIASLGLYSTVPIILTMYAQHCWNKKDYTQAKKLEETLLKLPAIPPLSKEETRFAYDSLQMISYEEGNLDDIIKYLESALSVGEGFSRLLAHYYIIKGEYDKALKLSETYNFSRFRVDAYVMKDDYVSALKELELKSELTYYDHLFKLALQKAIEGDIDSDCFEEFVTNNPKIVKKFSNDIESLRKKPTTKKYSSVANFKANILKKRERFY